MESSKATAKHIKQVASNPQAAQINLMHHQHTELPPSNFKRKQKPFKSRQDNNKQYYNEENKEKECHKSIRNIIIIKHMQAQKDVQNVMIHNI